MTHKRELAFSILPLIDHVDLDYLRVLRALGLKTVHYDVMDEFTGTRGFDPEHVDPLSNLGFNVNVHLMVQRVASYLRVYAKSKASRICFHVEALNQPADGVEFLTFLKRHKKEAGIAFKIGTDINAYLELLKYVDYITLMSVEPGKGGQIFDPRVFALLADVRTALKLINREDVALEFDGGITAKEIQRLKPYGTFFVSGSWFHKLSIPEKRLIIQETAN